jgi:Tol biopolymer transport system component/DNA-binding winged helix-turn-helix (wHTH) protein
VVVRSTTVIEWDDFRLDLGAFRLDRAGVPVPLEPKAIDVLALLVAEPGRLVTKQEIFDRVWPETAVSDHALTRVIAQLRRGLGDQSRDARYIETVPTRGYRWIGAIRPLSAGPPDAPEPLGPGPAVAGRARQLDLDPPAATSAVASEPRHATVLWTAAAVGLLALLGAAIWLVRGDTRPVSNAAAWSGASGGVPWPVQLTTHAGLDLTPALSPRGDALAFASDRSGTIEIYVRPLTDGGEDLPLTSDGGHNVQPAWSPDGTMLAYHSAGRGGIWVMPARGGAARQLVTEGSNPAWSPDGRTIAYQTDEHTDITPSAFGAQAGSTLGLVEVDGSGARPLTRSGAPLGGHSAPAWSPDGRFIGFTTFDGGPDTGAWVVAVADGRITRLTESPRVYELTFAPDASALYAAGGEALIYRIPFDPKRGVAAGPIEPLPIPGVPGVRGLSLAADGSRIAFAGLTLNSQIWAQPVTREGSARGDAYALTMDSSRRNWMPAIAPDGSRVAYMSTRRGDPPNVWLMNIDGANKAQLTADQFADGKPTWYQDGKRLAYFSFRGEESGLWAVDIATRRESRVTLDRTDQRYQPWNGRAAEIELAPSMTQAAVSMVMRSTGLRQVFVTPFDRLEPRMISDERKWVGYPAWSPDEKSLAVELKEGSSTHAAVIDVSSGQLRQLTHERGQTWVRSWSPDGTRLAMATLRGGSWSLRWLDVASGLQGEMLPPGPPFIYVRYPEWSPRGDLVVFERGELRGNIWTLPLRRPGSGDSPLSRSD